MKGAIIYITSNREDPMFEAKILDDLLDKRGDLPLYIVSQKLIETWADDIYIKMIGNVGMSGFNFCRQLQMCIKMADVDYVISCEADCLYSPDYFKFIPPKLDKVYRNTNNYVIPYKKDYWKKKKSQTAFQIAGRDFLLNRLNYLLKDQPMWNAEMKSFPKEIGKSFLEGWDIFKTKYPCFQIKTGNGMRKATNSGKEKYYKLPYWGKASDVRKEYL